MTIRSILLALAAILLASFSEPAVAKCELQKAAEMPVTMVGLRPVITAKINGADVRLFIDTGSFFSTLNPEAAQRLGMRTEALPPYFQVRGLTGAADMRLGVAREFDIMGARLHQVDFLVGEHSLGGAEGLIGQNMLANFDVEYDLANGVVRLFVPKGCGGSADLAYWAGAANFITIRSIQPPSNQIIGPVSINGVKIEALFDTGTPRSGLTLAAAKRAGVRIDASDVESAGTGGGVGARTIDTWIAPFASFGIGGETVKGTRLRVANFEIGDADMLLGTDFFLSHHIYVARSQNRLYFTYNGGPVFNLEQGIAGSQPSQGAAADAAPPGAPTGTPTTAADFSRRAAALVARHEYEPAITDYNQAIALAPTDAQNFYDRGVARILNHQPVIAMGDFDQALALKPDDPRTLMLRGELRLQSQDAAGAQADFAAAVKLDPQVALQIGDAYARAGQYRTAIQDFDGWIAAHPRNEDLSDALEQRCRARTMLGVDLDKALRDCNDALRYRAGASEYLATRGLVRLRLGQLDPAIADFDAAIRLQPKAPWALYGRGLAELRKGDKERGAADLAAAAAVDPHLTERATKAGFTP